eukprot:2630589-Amphidinium_carterae.1
MIAPTSLEARSSAMGRGRPKEPQPLKDMAGQTQEWFPKSCTQRQHLFEGQYLGDGVNAMPRKNSSDERSTRQ